MKLDNDNVGRNPSSNSQIKRQLRELLRNLLDEAVAALQERRQPQPLLSRRGLLHGQGIEIALHSVIKHAPVWRGGGMTLPTPCGSAKRKVDRHEIDCVILPVRISSDCRKRGVCGDRRSIASAAAARRKAEAG